MNRQQRRQAFRQNRGARTPLAGDPMAAFLGYKEVALSDCPEAERDQLARNAAEMDAQGIGPCRFYLRPDGQYTVMSATQFSR